MDYMNTLIDIFVIFMVNIAVVRRLMLINFKMLIVVLACAIILKLFKSLVQQLLHSRRKFHINPNPDVPPVAFPSITQKR